MTKNSNTLWVSTLLVVLSLVIFFTAFYVFKEIYLPIEGKSDEFNFKNFFLFNYIFKLLGYALKITLYYSFFKLLFLVFDIEKKIPLFRIVLLGEIIYILSLKGFIILYHLINNNISLDEFATYESNSSLAYFLPQKLMSFKHVIGFITVFDLIYILIIVLMISDELKNNFWKTLKTIGLSYFVLLFVIGLAKTLLTL